MSSLTLVIQRGPFKQTTYSRPWLLIKSITKGGCILITSIFTEPGLTIPKWLSKTSWLKFDEKHREIYEVAKKTPRAWTWVLKRSEFKNWKDWQATSGDEEPRRLLCSGIPGAGKTVLASIVVEHVRSTLQANGRCLFIYFDFNKNREGYALRDLYSSLLTQLVQGRSSFTKEAHSAFQTWDTTHNSPSTAEYLKILIAEIRTLSSVYIVIDALDECLNSDDIRNSTRSGLLKALRSFPSNTHILFTARQDSGIKREVQGHDHIDILATKDDLLEYLDNRVADREDLKSTLSKQGSLEYIFRHIVERSKGM
ncbi:hypothetical protein F4802DRAFT_443046 [Xylaria palmicola]|nr:hypothetical protein F4802DRAFT_443046 [Xylaria palmicola]